MFNELKFVIKRFYFMCRNANKSKEGGFKLSTIPSYERRRIAGTKKVNAFWDGLLILIKMIKMFFSK